MLQAVTLVLALVAAQEPLTIKGEVRNVPPQGKDGPLFVCEGTANLPNGCGLVAQLYYGKPVTGRELFSNTTIVKGGKFSQDFPIFAQRNFPGDYVVRLVYDPALQGLEAPDCPRTVVDLPLQIGGPQDVDREGKVVREQLVGEIRAILALADQIKAKLDEYRDKPEKAEREAAVKAWTEKMLEIRKRADPRKHREYFVLELDMMADSGMEDLSGILLSSARCFVLNQREITLEGLTRLRQTCEYWIGEISHPRLSDPGAMVTALGECRTIARRVLEKPDEPVLPARRRFLELTAILDKSVPADFHEVILGITSRSTAFFNAAADKSPDVKKLHQDLDGLLERFAATLSGTK